MDAALFQTEVKLSKKLLFRIAWSYLGHSQDVEDVVQEAITIAWSKRNSLRDEKQFRPWLVQILCNQCKNMLRRRRKFSFFPLEEDTVLVDPPETDAPIIEALQTLKPELRMVITLYYVDGYSVRDISETMRIPQGTVQTRLQRARKHLKNSLLVEWEEQL